MRRSSTCFCAERAISSAAAGASPQSPSNGTRDKSRQRARRRIIGPGLEPVGQMEEHPPTGTRVVARHERGRIGMVLVEQVLDEQVGAKAAVDLADAGGEPEEGHPVDRTTRVAGSPRSRAAELEGGGEAEAVVEREARPEVGEVLRARRVRGRRMRARGRAGTRSCRTRSRRRRSPSAPRPRTRRPGLRGRSRARPSPRGRRAHRSRWSGPPGSNSRFRPRPEAGALVVEAGFDAVRDHRLEVGSCRCSREG